ncbi:DUF1592 domain-containing protein [Sandaracinus amylolyticus]|uniref:Cellulose-binding domain protein n=1 Tax=Sandaracinus amylolyticus TaxID=927083 RepID=A0A0F6YHH0_9BACT|nr:DUF1592 domain-containing protein [Sandaracinus amylolyticus]AKF05647.1 Cellulose-binding domain protein [Sandaracinus amylolyticus]
MTRVLLIALCGALAGCLGQIGGPAAGPDGVPTDRPPTDEPDPPVVPPVDPTARCETSEVGPPLLRRLTRGEIDRTLRTVFPEIAGEWSGVRLGPDLNQTGFTNNATALVVGNQTARDLLETAEDVATLMTRPATLSATLPCASSGDAGCAGQLVDRYGARLFRRPLTSDERSRYVALHQRVSGESDFATGAKWTLVAMIQSPHAVYRSEIGGGAGFAAGDTRELDAYELASQLSYTFGGSPPDDALLAMARSGGLVDPAVRIAEARRLLETPGGHAVVQQFFREHFRYENVASQTKEHVGEAFAQVRGAMVDETSRFVDEVLYERDGDLTELLTADYTIADPPLAAFYGFAAPAGATPSLITRPEGRGIGLLAQGSILAGTSNVTHSSPTNRGLLVFERLLCQVRRPPPPGVSTQLEPAEGRTTRERIETVHTRDAFCASCHSQFDPIGFGFEHYDEAGRYRELEAGIAVDASGSIPQTGAMFVGQEELARALAASEDVAVCVSGQMTLYAYGGGGQVECLGEGARQALLDGEVGILEFLAALAAEPHFTSRRVR